MFSRTHLKTALYALTWLWLFPLLGQGQPCVPVPSGLISWWPGEGNALDSGGTNHGALIGNVSYAASRVGLGFVFDGSGDAVRVGNPTSLQLQDLTVEAWIKRNSTSKVSLDAGGGVIFGGGIGGYALGFFDDGHVYLSKPGGPFVSSTFQITDTNFHHVAWTKSGTSVVFYVDGVAYPAAGFISTFTFTSQIAIGARGDNSGNSFLGLIDDLAVFNRALSTVEVQSIYNAGNQGKCGLPPSIISQPAGRTNNVGDDATFGVVATGTSPLNYQWQFNTTNIVGAVNATLNLTNVQVTNSGSYSVVVSNAVDSVISSNATFRVNTPICVLAPTNLVSWWPGEGNALDSGGTNHGALIGNVSYAASRVGLGFVFDGSGDAVRVGNPTSLQLQDLTVEAWIKRNSTAQASLNAGGGVIFGGGIGGYG